MYLTNPSKVKRGRAARIHRGGDVLNLKWFLPVLLLHPGKRGSLDWENVLNVR